MAAAGYVALQLEVSLIETLHIVGTELCATGISRIAGRLQLSAQPFLIELSRLERRLEWYQLGHLSRSKYSRYVGQLILCAMRLHHYRLRPLGGLIAANDTDAFSDQAICLQYLTHLGELLFDVARKVTTTHRQRGEQIAQAHCGTNAAGTGGTPLDLSLVVQFDFNS